MHKSGGGIRQAPQRLGEGDREGVFQHAAVGIGKDAARQCAVGFGVGEAGAGGIEEVVEEAAVGDAGG